MTGNGKDMNPKTTVWKEKDREKVLLKTMPGLPYGIPKMGQKVTISQYGEAICSGVTKSGSGNNEEIIEIQLTVK